MKEKVILHLERCKGCYLCASVCPTKAITSSGELGVKGYVTIKVDQDKCVQCGSCYKMCPDYVIEVV